MGYIVSHSRCITLSQPDRCDNSEQILLACHALPVFDIWYTIHTYLAIFSFFTRQHISLRDSRFVQYNLVIIWYIFPKLWMILCMCPANERRRYIVKSSLIGWAHSQNDPCKYSQQTSHSLPRRASYRMSFMSFSYDLWHYHCCIVCSIML